MQADTEQRKGRDSIWSAPFVVLMAVNFFQSMAAFMANATLPVFADSLGATASMVGIVVSSFTLSALLVRPFAGPAFDSFSRKRLLLIAQGIICLSFFAYGFVDSLGVLIAIRLFHGVASGAAGLWRCRSCPSTCRGEVRQRHQHLRAGAVLRPGHRAGYGTLPGGCCRILGSVLPGCGASGGGHGRHLRHPRALSRAPGPTS